MSRSGGGAGDPEFPASSSDPLPLQFLRDLIRAREVRIATSHLMDEGELPAAFPPFTTHAASIGATAALRRRSDGSADVLGLSPRCVGAVFSMGVTPLEFFRRVLARGNDAGSGKAPGIQWSDPGRGIIGPIWPAGTSLEIMAGITLSFRMTGEDRVGLLFSEAAAVATGAWHEGLNFAAVRRCPLVVIVDAPDTPVSTRLTSFLEVCEGYGIRGHTADGSNALEAHSVATAAIGHARSGDGVQLVELAFPTQSPRDFGLGEIASVEWQRIEGEVRSEVENAMRQALGEARTDAEEALRGVLSDWTPEPPWAFSPNRTPSPTTPEAT